MQPVLQVIQASTAKADSAPKSAVEDQVSDADFSAVFDTLVPKNKIESDPEKSDSAITNGDNLVIPKAEADLGQKNYTLPEVASVEEMQSVEFDGVESSAEGSKLFRDDVPSLPSDDVDHAPGLPKSDTPPDFVDRLSLMNGAGQSRSGLEDGAEIDLSPSAKGMELRQKDFQSHQEFVPIKNAKASPQNHSPSDVSHPNLGQDNGTRESAQFEVSPGQIRSVHGKDAQPAVIVDAAQLSTTEQKLNKPIGDSHKAIVAGPGRPVADAFESGENAKLRVSNTEIFSPPADLEKVTLDRAGHLQAVTPILQREVRNLPSTGGRVTPESVQPSTFAAPATHLAPPSEPIASPNIIPGSTTEVVTPMAPEAKSGQEEVTISKKADGASFEKLKGDPQKGAMFLDDRRRVLAGQESRYADISELPTRSENGSKLEKDALNQKVDVSWAQASLENGRFQQVVDAEVARLPAGANGIVGQEAPQHLARNSVIEDAISGIPAPLVVLNNTPVPKSGTERSPTVDRSILETVDVRLARPAGRDGLARMAYLKSAAVVIGTSQRSVEVGGKIDDLPLALSEANPKELVVSTAPNSTQMVDSPRPIADLRQAQSISHQLMAAAKASPEGMIEISMRPEELGRVKMNMTINEGALAVHLTIERAETADLMRRHLEMFSQEFKSLGYTNVSFEFDGQHRQEKSKPAYASEQATMHEGSESEIGGLNAPKVQQTRLSTGLSGRVDMRL